MAPLRWIQGLVSSSSLSASASVKVVLREDRDAIGNGEAIGGG
jgi:hypothetical protein